MTVPRSIRPASARMALLLASVGAALLAAPSGAQALSCGDTINHSIKLHQNVDCSATNSDGLVIGKSGITLNLNGHSIIGPGGAAGSYSGVDNANSKDHVTIENGTIKDFYYDIYLYGGAKNTVAHVKMLLDGTRTYYGLYTYYVTGGQFTHNTTSNATEGFYIEDGSSNTIDHSKSIHSTYGVDVEYEAGDVISNNVSKGTPGTTYGLFDYHNFQVTWSDDVANNGYDGLYSDAPTQVKFTGITGSGNSNDGVDIEDNDPSSRENASIKNSVANNNGNYGMLAAFHVDSAHNTALNNASYDCYLVRCNG